MNWIEAIKKIREAQESNRLIIFVGAGVSKNRFAFLGATGGFHCTKIGYDNCALP